MLANVIIPAFGVPYALFRFAPWIAGLVFLIETAVIAPFFRKGKRRWAWGAVALANIGSYLVGFLFFGLVDLPTGIDPTYGREQYDTQYLPEWEMYVLIAFVLAYVASVLVEAVILRLFRKQMRYGNSLICSIVVNAASYLGIGALFVLL
jgi:hypothetical protein